MNPRTSSLLVLGLVAVLLTPLHLQASPLVDNETLKLPCGRVIKILSISKVESSEGVMALMVRYQTTLTVDQRKALSEEVDDFWKIAVKEGAEHNGYSEAIISSNEVPKGVFFTASHMLNFLYEKGPDGKWTRLNSDVAMQ